MILRKPFAILIKNFKLIHLVMAGLAIYLTIKTSQLMSFFSTYLADVTNVAGNDLVGTLFNPFMFFAIFIILIAAIIVASLMAFKGKPILFYVINILIYIYIIVVFFFTKSIVSSLEIGLVDVRTLKLVQDLLTTAFILEFVNLILLSIRATGFDIKKFDFVKDLEELEVTDIDNEEFEVNFEVDTDKVTRKIRRFFRHARYIYKENKLVFHLTLALVIGVGCYFTYSRLILNRREYKEDVSFQAYDFIMSVQDSYIAENDYQGKAISKDNVLVVVKIKLQMLYSTTFEPARLILNLKDHNFYVTTSYKEKISDLGTTYNGEKITGKSDTYIFAYEIPKGFKDEIMELNYDASNGSNYLIKLTPDDFSKRELKTYGLKDTISLKNSFVGDIQFQFDERGYNIDTSFKSPYNFCQNNKCTTSYEILKPSFSDNYDKIVFYANTNYIAPENAAFKNITDLTLTFGEFTYEIDGLKKIFRPTKAIKPTKFDLEVGEMLLEIPSEMMNATNIKLRYVVRDKTYEINFNSVKV